MKVNLPMNASQTRAPAPAKTAGQTEHNAVSPFSIQMSRILRQVEQKGGTAGGHSQHDNDEYKDDEKSSMANNSVQEAESEVSGRNAKDSRADIHTGPDVEDKSGCSGGRMEEGGARIDGGPEREKADNSSEQNNGHVRAITDNKGVKSTVAIQEGNAVEKNTPSDGAGTLQKGVTESNSATGRAALNEPFMSESQSSDNGQGGADTRNNAGLKLTMDNVLENPAASAVETDPKKAIRSSGSRHGNTRYGLLESGKLLRMVSGSVDEKQIHDAETINQRDAARNHDFSQKPESEGNSERMTTVKAFHVNEETFQTIAGRTANPAKGLQTEALTHVSAGSPHATESNTPIGTNTVKPLTLNSNEFLTQVAERIHFLIRDGGDVVRIRLQPDEFGNMEIRAESTARGLTVRISAETGIIKNLLESNIHILQQNLQELGLKVDRIQVMLQDLFDSQSGAGHSSKSGHFNPEQNEKGSHRNHGGDEKSPEDATPGNMDAALFSLDRRFHTVA